MFLVYFQGFLLNKKNTLASGGGNLLNWLLPPLVNFPSCWPHTFIALHKKTQPNRLHYLSIKIGNTDSTQNLVSVVYKIILDQCYGWLVSLVNCLSLLWMNRLSDMFSCELSSYPPPHPFFFLAPWLPGCYDSPEGPMMIRRIPFIPFNGIRYISLFGIRWTINCVEN